MARTYNLQDIFARNLKERRRKLSLTQAQLAEKIGVSTSFVTEIETSRKAPSFATIEKISAALDVPCWTFFCEDGDKLPQRCDGDGSVRLQTETGHQQHH